MYRDIFYFKGIHVAFCEFEMFGLTIEASGLIQCATVSDCQPVRLDRPLASAAPVQHLL